MSKSGIGLWWKAVRPYAYPASIVPVFMGSMFAWIDGYDLSFGRAALVLLGVIAAHTAGNLINDIEDVRRGVDRPGTLGGNGVLLSGEMTVGETRIGAAVALIIAALCGAPLVIWGGWPILLLALFGALAAIGYGFAPLAFKYRALGNPIVFFSFGVGIVLGAYMVQTGSFSWNVVTLSIPIGLLATGILVINNLRDIDDDRVAGILTLEGLLGAKRGGRFYSLLLSATYGVLILGVVIDLIPIGALAALVSIPLSIPILLRARTSAVVGPSFLVGEPEHAAQLMLAFGVTGMLGMAIQKVLF